MGPPGRWRSIVNTLIFPNLYNLWIKNEITIFEGAEHVDLMRFDSTLYRKAVSKFLETVLED